jgi:hypothetical protein
LQTTAESLSAVTIKQSSIIAFVKDPPKPARSGRGDHPRGARGLRFDAEADLADLLALVIPRINVDIGSAQGERLALSSDRAGAEYLAVTHPSADGCSSHAFAQPPIAWRLEGDMFDAESPEASVTESRAGPIIARTN